MTTPKPGQPKGATMRITIHRVLVLGMLPLGCDLEDGEPLPAAVSLPNHGYCDAARSWPDDDDDREQALLERINEHRSTGADCGARGRFGPANPLVLAGAPWCAARNQAAQMAANDAVSPADPEGQRPADRLRLAGYTFAVADEVLGAGELDPYEVVDELWMTREGSCAALMANEYVHAGVGWASPAQDVTFDAYFAVTVARPRTPL